MNQGGGDGGASELVVRVEVIGFEEAVRVLDDDGHQRIDQLVVYRTKISVGADEDEGVDGGIRRRMNDRRVRGEHRLFRRFVTLLGGALTRPTTDLLLRKLDLRIDWNGLNDDDMDRLFGEVLPKHRSLEHINVYVYELPIRFLQLLTMNWPSTAEESSLPNKKLTVSGWMDSSRQELAVQAIANLLKRNAALTHLHLQFNLDAEQCQRICDSVRRNTNLRSLHLSLWQCLEPKALDGVAASSLQSFELSAGSAVVTRDAASSLAIQLRTNDTLQRLWLGILDPRDARALLQLVKNYNYTLHTLGKLPTPHMKKQSAAYLHRNHRLRIALEEVPRLLLPQLQSVPSRDKSAAVMISEREGKLSDKEVETATTSWRTLLVPHILGLLSDVPTALFRVLKMGYVNEVGPRLASNAPRHDAKLHDDRWRCHRSTEIHTNVVLAAACDKLKSYTYERIVDGTVDADDELVSS